MRMTRPLVQVAAALMAAPDEEHWGYQLCRDTGLESGVLHPILQRMRGRGWLIASPEPDEAAADRPPRNYQQLTPEGRRELTAIIERARGDRRFDGIPGLGESKE